MRSEFRRAVEDAVGQDLEVGPDLADQIADHEAVGHPERVVRDHHDRPGGRDRRQPRGIVVDLQPQMADRRLPEALARTRPAPVVEVETLEKRLAGQAVDGPDGDPTQRRIAR
jgi:hypothetical protein